MLRKKGVYRFFDPIFIFLQDEAHLAHFQKWKSAQKAIYALFARYPSIITRYSNAVHVSRVDSVITNAGYQQSSLAEKEVIAR